MIIYQNKNRSFFFLGIMFLISPLITCIFALSNYKEKWAKFYCLLFIAFNAFTLIIVENSDSTRYRDGFLLVAKQNFSFTKFIQSFQNEQNSSIDILEPLISFITSSVSNNYHVLFMVYGIVFGFFYTKNLWFLFSFVDKKGIKNQAYIYLFTIGIIWCIWDINVFRYTTASLMFICGTLPYLIDKNKNKNKNGLLLAFFSVFMHYSFIMPALLFVIYILAGNRINFYFILFFVAIFISEIDFEFIKNASLFFPESLQDKTSTYANEDFAEYRAEITNEKVWYAMFYQKVLKWVTWFTLLQVYWHYKRSFQENMHLKQLLSFSLLFYGVFLILNNIPVMNRFLFTGSLYVMALQFYFLQTTRMDKVKKLFVGLTTIPLIFFCIVRLRIGFGFISINTILGSPVSTLFISEWDSILSFFK